MNIAKKTHNILKCGGVTRSDFKFFNNIFYLLEINTQPGMTSLSLVPEIAKFKGLTFENLIEKCTELGADRFHHLILKHNNRKTLNIDRCKKIIIASSETAYGICFAHGELNPKYLPIDEKHPTEPMDSYGLSKVVNEETAKAFSRRSGLDIYVLRIGNVIEPHEYHLFNNFFEFSPVSKLSP